MNVPIRSCFSFGVFAVAIAVWPGIVFAQEIASVEELQSNLDDFLEWRASNTSGLEFYTGNDPMEDGYRTTVALVIDDVDLDEASVALEDPRSWCELMFLHLNVKACVYGGDPEDQWVRLYMGRKFYQPPKKAEQIELKFKAGNTDGGVSWAELTADEGPYGTSDYYIGLFAIKAEGGTYAELRSSQKAGGAVQTAQKVYFNTLARKKVGFSVTGTDEEGNPEFVRGQQAMLERNIVRYLLALRAYMLTHHLEGFDGMFKRADMWFDATERYPEQLREVEKDDYLEAKRKEHENQEALQSEVAGGS